MGNLFSGQPVGLSLVGSNLAAPPSPPSKTAKLLHASSGSTPTTPTTPTTLRSMIQIPAISQYALVQDSANVTHYLSLDSFVHDSGGTPGQNNAYEIKDYYNSEPTQKNSITLSFTGNMTEFEVGSIANNSCDQSPVGKVDLHLGIGMPATISAPSSQVLFSDGTAKNYTITPDNDPFLYTAIKVTVGNEVQPVFSLQKTPYKLRFSRPSSSDAILSGKSFSIKCPDHTTVIMKNGQDFYLPVKTGYTSSILNGLKSGFYGITGWLPSKFNVVDLSFIPIPIYSSFSYQC